jgi:hypothetical protein
MSHNEALMAIAEQIASCARGTYQENLLAGIERWSGSTLKGKAREYGGRYFASRCNLLARIRGALKPYGWTADTQLMLTGDPPRNTRELALRSLDGESYRWHCGGLVKLHPIRKWGAGYFYRVAYGNGSQYFWCDSVSEKGKPSGWRLFGYTPQHGGGEWRQSSFKIDDRRIKAQVALPANATPIPESYEERLAAEGGGDFEELARVAAPLDECRSPPTVDDINRELDGADLGKKAAEAVAKMREGKSHA